MQDRLVAIAGQTWSSDYLRSGDEKNFPWRLNPTADLLLLPNLQQKMCTS